MMFLTTKAETKSPYSTSQSRVFFKCLHGDSNRLWVVVVVMRVLVAVHFVVLPTTTAQDLSISVNTLLKYVIRGFVLGWWQVMGLFQWCCWTVQIGLRARSVHARIVCRFDDVCRQQFFFRLLQAQITEKAIFFALTRVDRFSSCSQSIGKRTAKFPHTCS